MSPFASMSDQHSVSVSNAHTTKTRKTIRTILQHEQGQSYYICEEDEGEPEILSLAGSVFPPMRSAFFPQETWLNYHQTQENWDQGKSLSSIKFKQGTIKYGKGVNYLLDENLICRIIKQLIYNSHSGSWTFHLNRHAISCLWWEHYQGHLDRIQINMSACWAYVVKTIEKITKQCPLQAGIFSGRLLGDK